MFGNVLTIGLLQNKLWVHRSCGWPFIYPWINSTANFSKSCQWEIHLMNSMNVFYKVSKILSQKWLQVPQLTLHCFLLTWASFAHTVLYPWICTCMARITVTHQWNWVCSESLIGTLLTLKFANFRTNTAYVHLVQKRRWYVHKSFRQPNFPISVSQQRFDFSRCRRNAEPTF